MVSLSGVSCSPIGTVVLIAGLLGCAHVSQNNLGMIEFFPKRSQAK